MSVISPEQSHYKELLECLQGCWQNVKELHEFYLVQDASVTRIRQNTGETMEFSRVLKPDSSGSGLQWGLHGRFVLQIDTSTLTADSDLTQVSWLTPEEAHVQALSGPREPGTQGVKGWRWQRVDPLLAGVAPGVPVETAAPSAPAPAPVPPASPMDSPTDPKQAALAQLQGSWKNCLDDNECYVVRGLDVMRYKVGFEAKPFRLHWDDATGRLWWGSTGRYSLQPPADTQKAVWESKNGSRGFTWERTEGPGGQKGPQPPSTPPPPALYQAAQMQMRQQQVQMRQQQQQQQMLQQQYLQQQQHMQMQQQMMRQRQMQQYWQQSSYQAVQGHYWPHQQQWHNLPVSATRYSPY
ncbi:unnamed protein product [Effrenium voratum]|nr:unnamed protein product [Effrenium voratum]